MKHKKILPCKFVVLKELFLIKVVLMEFQNGKYVTHKDGCVVKEKEPFGVQDGVSWHSLSDWTNFYSGAFTET